MFCIILKTPILLNVFFFCNPNVIPIYIYIYITKSNQPFTQTCVARTSLFSEDHSESLCCKHMTPAQVTHRCTGRTCILTFLYSVLQMLLRLSVSSNTWNTWNMEVTCLHVCGRTWTHTCMEGLCVFGYKRKANQWHNLWLNWLTLKTLTWVQLALIESICMFNAMALKK